jgi:hypothetical protein
VNSQGFNQTLIEQWNGTNWSIVPSPNAGSSDNLDGVTRIPGTGAVGAVGYYYNTVDSPYQTLVEYHC